MLTAFAFPVSQSAQASGFPYKCTYTANLTGGSYYEDFSWDPWEQTPGQNVLLQEGAAYCTGNPVTFELVLQGDGNLVIYDHSGRALWASNTDIHNPTQAEMQTDGNFVIYSGGHALWATGTNGQPGPAGPYLCFQNDGNLVIYGGAFDCGGYALWASGT
jgi:hypothetical protein